MIEENKHKLPQPWLIIIGIGEDGLEGLSARSLKLLQEAKHVFGGQRHLSFLNENYPAQRHLWPRPLLNVIDDISALRNEKVVVLASGDPMFFGIGATFCKYFDIREMLIIPHSSAFSLAAARMGWPLQDITCLSVHGRPLSKAWHHLKPGKKFLILPHNGDTPNQLAAYLASQGWTDSSITILSHLGGAHEEIQSFNPDIPTLQNFDDLHVIALDCRYGIKMGEIENNKGVLPDSAFIHDGLITKQDIRSIVLTHLAPRNGQLLWDVGAGSGAISIDWLRSGQHMQAFAIEKDQQRIKNIEKNRQRLGMSALEIIDGEAPHILDKLNPPDSIFIGGGLSDDGVFEWCWKALKEGGILVATAVTHESEQMMMMIRRNIGAKLLKISISNADDLGKYQIWRPSLPITIMIANK